MQTYLVSVTEWKTRFAESCRAVPEDIRGKTWKKKVLFVCFIAEMDPSKGHRVTLPSFFDLTRNTYNLLSGLWSVGSGPFCSTMAAFLLLFLLSVASARPPRAPQPLPPCRMVSVYSFHLHHSVILLPLLTLNHSNRNKISFSSL